MRFNEHMYLSGSKTFPPCLNYRGALDFDAKPIIAFKVTRLSALSIIEREKNSRRWPTYKRHTVLWIVLLGTFLR